MSRPSLAWIIGLLSLLVGCDQLGNPPQFATGPTAWNEERGHIVTTTRSFRSEKTIRRLVSEGLSDLDYADASIGPSQTLTLVSAVPRRLNARRRSQVDLVTILKFPDRPPVVRRWNAPASSRHWAAAFATPEPPIGALTALAP